METNCRDGVTSQHEWTVRENLMFSGDGAMRTKAAEVCNYLVCSQVVQTQG